MKWWKPVAALGALAAAPFVLPALGIGAAGAGAAGAGAAATGAGVAGLVNTPAVLAAGMKGVAGSGLGATLMGGLKAGATGALRMLPQAGLGYLMGGPQGAMTMPFMPKGAGPSILGMDPTTVLMGLGGRAIGGMPGGLMGMGLAGMQNTGMADKLRAGLAPQPPGEKPTSKMSDPTRPKGLPSGPWWMQHG